MPDASRLAHFREGETKPKAWEPPTRFMPGRVLCIDQSLSATGWVLVNSMGDRLHVHTAGSIVTKPENYPNGYEGTLQRALYVARRLDQVVKDAHGVDAVVHETPPLAVGRMSRPEASLLASLGVRMAADKYGRRVVMVQNQHSKKVLLDVSRDVTKREWHGALNRYTIEGRELVTNEGQRDALCLALTHFIDELEHRRG